MNQRMKYSEQMKRYRLSIIAHVRLELEGEAKNEEEIRRKVVVQACPIAGTESLLGYFDLDSEFVYDPHEIRWESRRDAIHIESLQDCTHEYRYATFDSEHVRRYEITIAEQYRFELEVQARSESKAEDKAADWTCYPTNADSLFGYSDRYNDFPHVQCEVRWEFMESSSNRDVEKNQKLHREEGASQ